MLLSKSETIAIVELLEQIRPMVERVSTQTLEGQSKECPHCGSAFGTKSHTDHKNHSPDCMAFEALDRLHTVDDTIKALKRLTKP